MKPEQQKPMAFNPDAPIGPNAFAQRSIPGQSLTNDPENPLPFEKPPKHTNLRKAQETIFSKLISEEVYVPTMEMIESGEATIMEVAQMILFSGFKKGQWNPDMMLMLAEPTAYMVMALAERAGIDYEIDREPDEDEEDPADKFKKTISQKKPTKAPETAIPKEIQDRLDEAPVESLLKKPEPKEESLIEKPTDG